MAADTETVDGRETVAVDTHCHLISHKYGSEARRIAERSLSRGVRMLTVAGDVESSYASVDLAEGGMGMRASVGVHPTEAGGLDEGLWGEVSVLAERESVVAIGETGLDYYWKECPPDVQKFWFSRHMELAVGLGKPVSVHARDSVRDTLGMMEPFLARGLRAVWHCFVAGKKDIVWGLDFAIEHGVFLGVGGLVTFEDQKPLRREVVRIPEGLLLLETDSPYLVPRPKMMDRNEPFGVLRVAEVLGELRGSDFSSVCALTTENARCLLGDWVSEPLG